VPKAPIVSVTEFPRPLGVAKAPAVSPGSPRSVALISSLFGHSFKRFSPAPAPWTQFGPAPLTIPPRLATDTTGSCRALTKAPIKFVRHQNVERYRRLLENVTDEIRRDHLLKLLAEAKQKQKDAEDPVSLY
jgi:hypothetical protein